MAYNPDEPRDAHGQWTKSALGGRTRIIEHEGRRYQIKETPYGSGSDVHVSVNRIKKDGKLAIAMHPGTPETHAVLHKAALIDRLRGGE